VNQGWAVVNTGLASERAYVGANAVMLELLFDDLVELARNIEYPSGLAIDDPVIREALADFSASVSAVECIARRAVDRVATGTDVPADALVAKLAYTELNVAICLYAVNLAASGRLLPRGAEVYARWQQAFLWSRALTISGGSSEIVRNVLATQLFGFPRSW
jgi:alkylation response protein AidB-like acyl-CoA dehydrogenase